MMTVLPNAVLYGLANRTVETEVDVSFTDFGETLRSLFKDGTPIIGICAAGILIRTLAPLLSNKQQEPPVLAAAEDGSAIVPLLGGLQGVNELARQLAVGCGGVAAITTAGDLRFRTALLAPPAGYHLANPEDAKTFIADLLAGATVQLEGAAPWLSESQLPLAIDGSLKICVSEHSVAASRSCLVYHPATLAIGIDGRISSVPSEAISFIQEQLTAADLSPAAIAAVFTLETYMGHLGIQAIAQTFNVPVRFLSIQDIEPQPTELSIQIAMRAVGSAGRLVVADTYFAIAAAPLPLDVNQVGRSRGRLAIVGTGPGSAEWMSPEVKAILQSTTDWVGYSTYLNLVEPLRQGQQRHESDNRVELERARLAFDLAAEGRSVAVISSGDPGIYAMASAVFEVLEQDAKPEWQSIELQVAPGISALQAAAARIGAPIGHDFCAISLSDILKPWSMIEQRIRAAAEADFVIAFYNPTSTQRTWQVTAARDLLLHWRSPNTPIVLARNVGRAGESVVVRSLEQLSADEVDMRTLILVGSSKTRMIVHANGKWVYTPRRYD
ncbi:precorrin-3B C(17)-methyltransferase [Phormidium tenue FACHB-886]|nr:precorrin-3B C(17)-methyltransferase [Phormidium tenue FACHB-886]